jgi:hypothetical protein
MKNCKAGERFAASGGSAAEDEYFSTPEYQAFLAECAKHCRCTHQICGGVLAGGFCDEIIEDDSEYEDFNHDE